MNKSTITLVAGLLSASLQAMEPNTAAAPAKSKKIEVPAAPLCPPAQCLAPNTAAAPPALGKPEVSAMRMVPLTQDIRDYYRKKMEHWVFEDMYTMGNTRKDPFADAFITLCYDEFDVIELALKADSQYGLFKSIVKLLDAKSRIAGMAMDEVEHQMALHGNLASLAPAQSAKLQTNLKRLDEKFLNLEHAGKTYNAEMRIRLKPYLDVREKLVAQGIERPEELDLWSHELSVDQDMLCWLIDEVFADDWVGVYRKPKSK